MDATTVEVAVNVPAALAALVALELAQVAAPGGAAVVQGAAVTVERLGDDGGVVAVGVGEADDGQEDEEDYEKEVAGGTGGGGGGHSWGKGVVGTRQRDGANGCVRGKLCALPRVGADNFL